MNEALDYPRIIYVAVRHAPTFKNLKKILSQKLIPASSFLPNIPLDANTAEEIRQSIESSELDSSLYNQTYHEINALITLQNYEWVVLNRPGGKLLAAPIKRYVFSKSQSSPIHHYIEFITPALTIPYSDIDSSLMHVFRTAENLSELPYTAAELINAHRPGSLERTRRIINSPSQQLIPLDNLPKQISSQDNNTVFKEYFSSSLALQQYLAATTTSLTELYIDNSDLAYDARLLNNSEVRVLVYRLKDGRGNGCWYAESRYKN